MIQPDREPTNHYFRDLYQLFKRSLWIWLGIIVGLWILSAALIVVLLPSWSERGQFGDLFGAVNSLFSGLAFAGIVIALFLQNKGLRLQFEEMQKAHEWNRRKSAHDLVFEASLGRFRQLRDRLEPKIDLYNKRATYEDSRGTLAAEDLIVLDASLNFIECVCLTIKNHVIDEDIVFDSLDGIFIEYFRWSKPYIDECRSKIHSRLWTEIDPFVESWSARREQIMRRVREPPKPRL